MRIVCMEIMHMLGAYASWKKSSVRCEKARKVVLESEGVVEVAPRDGTFS